MKTKDQREELPDLTDRSPLGWTGDGCADVSIHLDNARKVAGTLMSIDGVNHLDSLPEGAVCVLMFMLDEELSAVESILEQGGAK